MYRYRLQITKADSFKFTSHLEFIQAIYRTMQRADLPIHFTEGFNPRPKYSYCLPLPLGYTSECELMDIFLDGDLHPEELKTVLNKKFPEGIIINQCEKIELNSPTLSSKVKSATYILTLNPIDFLTDFSQVNQDATKVAMKELSGKWEIGNGKWEVGSGNVEDALASKSSDQSPIPNPQSTVGSKQYAVGNNEQRITNLQSEIYNLKSNEGEGTGEGDAHYSNIPTFQHSNSSGLDNVAKALKFILTRKEFVLNLSSSAKNNNVYFEIVTKSGKGLPIGEIVSLLKDIPVSLSIYRKSINFE